MKKDKKKSVVVFGGSGFLGSHTADELSKHGFNVTIYDINESKYLRNDQKMVIGDVLDNEKVHNVIKDSNIVYNFSGIADIKDSSANPLKTIESNIIGNSIILEACSKYKLSRFIFASSMYVYSKYGSIYRATKQSCELITETFCEEHDLPYTILRYGSLYGPRCSEWNGVYKVLKDAVANKKIIFEGSGDEYREFINVKDAASLSVKALDDAYKNNYLMLTGNEKLKYSDFIEMIKEILGGNIKIVFTKKEKKDHYILTPYTFKPKVAKKLVLNEYHDLGQGLLEQISEIYNKIVNR